jgi:hypothetical protein
MKESANTRCHGVTTVDAISFPRIACNSAVLECWFEDSCKFFNKMLVRTVVRNYSDVSVLAVLLRELALKSVTPPL